MWLIISVLVVVQMVGLMTILRFNSKVKKVERDNRRLKKVIKTGPQSKPIWEELGLSEKEYNETRNMVYSIDSNFPLYIPGLDDVVEPTTIDENDDVIEDDFDKPVQPKKSELSELLGIEDADELDEIKKQIEIGQEDQSSENKDKDSTKINDDILDDKLVEIENIEEDLAIIMNEIENEANPSVTVPPAVNDKVVVKVAPIGGALDLFEDIAKSINQEENDTHVLFSDDMHTSTSIYEIHSEIEGVPFIPSDEDVPNDVEEDAAEQARMIQILNLLDTESTRMNNELNITNIDEKTLAKQEIASKLAILTNEEGKNNLKEIVQLLSQLYEMEGKQNDMKTLREEYKEYFEEDNPVPIKIFEEDIISTEKGNEDNEEVFEIPERYLWMASAKISDGLQGKQRWLGKVIGLGSGGEVSFIHFRDISQRIWINVSSLDMSSIEKGDLLTVFVERNGDSIIANDVQPIKKTLA